MTAAVAERTFAGAACLRGTELNLGFFLFPAMAGDLFPPAFLALELVVTAVV